MKNNVSANDFELISINGRFVYSYLCLDNAIKHNGHSILPIELYKLLAEFLSSKKLDEWHSRVEDILPSFVVDMEEVKSKALPTNVVKTIKEYYAKERPFIVDIIEDLLWLAVSNLSVGFDSDHSLKYLRLILAKMKEHSIPLPDFSKIEHCSISQNGGWGNDDDLTNYVRYP